MALILEDTEKKVWYDHFGAAPASMSAEQTSICIRRARYIFNTPMQILVVAGNSTTTAGVPSIAPLLPATSPRTMQQAAMVDDFAPGLSLLPAAITHQPDQVLYHCRPIQRLLLYLNVGIDTLRYTVQHIRNLCSGLHLGCIIASHCVLSCSVRALCS